MSSPVTLLDGLARALDAAADAFERGVHWRAAVLWPDPENQFSGSFELLRAGLAPRSLALYCLGSYTPAAGIGPAIWLRTLLDADLPGASPPPDSIPIFLLPGLSAAALRHPQTLAKADRPLAELQYRGTIFRNRRQARDWTVGPFLRSPEQGLGLDIATDARTDEAAATALSALLAYPLADLPARRLVAEDFLRLIEPDEIRSLLAWIADPNAGRTERTAEAWESFRALAKGTYGIDVTAKGARQTAVERLAKGEGAWRRVLTRVDENPEQFRAVCEELRRAEQPALPGLGEPARGTSDENQHQERLLAAALLAAADLPHGEAATRVLALQDEHRYRRTTRWGKLGEAPLARVLEPLARLAAGVRDPVPGGDVLGLAQAYADDAYAVDLALLDSLAGAGPRGGIVTAIARTLYWPWVDALATRFRDALEADGTSARAKPLTVAPGTCLLFVDGLRYDIGRRLADRLAASEAVRLSWRLAPVPTVTATAKPLVTPVADAIRDVGRADLFLPLESSSGRPADTACLVAAMRARGIQVVPKGEAPAPSAPDAIGWAECGNLDHDGHSMGERLATRVEGEIEVIDHRVQALRQAGWPRVRIITDHGWLLVPGGLPKASIPASTLQNTAWSRVARLADGAAPEAATLPWHWDEHVRIIVPPGAHAFRAGEAYAHGGVSLQESVVPDIVVGGDAPMMAADARISAIAWRRYKLTVTLDREALGHEVEVRRVKRDPGSRVAAEILSREGPRFDLRIDPDLDEETPIVVVLLDAHGSVVDARKTAIGVN